MGTCVPTSTMATTPRTLLLLLLITLVLLECVSAGKEKKKKPCKYNGKKYKAGDVIESLADNCVEFKCSKKGKKTELVVIEGCNCCEGATEPPTSDCDYSTMSTGSDHTMNLPKPDKDTCAPKDYRVSQDDIDIILDTHNKLRAKVANGDESLGCPGPQPSATNMMELKWNSQLAEVAQAWAEQCPGGHDDGDDRKICDPDYYVGQNIYFSWSYDPTDAWEKAINAWYDEVKDMPNTLVESFGSNTCSGVIGHYTQVVWAETYEVGCGAIHYPAKIGDTTYPESKIYVCNYGPGGNWLGSPVYESGDAASNCPNAESTDYPGLCT